MSGDAKGTMTTTVAGPTASLTTSIRVAPRCGPPVATPALSTVTVFVSADVLTAARPPNGFLPAAPIWLPAESSAVTDRRQSTMSASPASTARGVRWSARWRTSACRAGSSNTASRASAVTTARTNTCWPSPARAATSARAVTPSASRSGRSGGRPRSSPPCRTGRWWVTSRGTTSMDGG